MKKLIQIVFISIGFLGIAQDVPATLNDSIDTNYREDQFYFGITYNLIGNKPENLSQNGFSTGLQAGFIRDFPINSRRSLAVGIGLGYSFNSINQNLLIQKNGDDANYQIVSNGDFTRNRLILHLLELPVEFRWRASTPTEFSFWRIYSGFKLGYVFASKYSYKGDPNDSTLTNFNGIKDLQYGLSLSIGYDKINLHFYYALSSLFNSEAQLNDRPIDLNIVKIGLIIYIL